jgi:hypothetical protein
MNRWPASITNTMIMASTLLLLGLLALVRAEEQVPLTGTTNIWEQLKAKVGGRLFEARPFAQSCFIDAMTVPDCRSVEVLSLLLVSLQILTWLSKVGVRKREYVASRKHGH